VVAAVASESRAAGRVGGGGFVVVGVLGFDERFLARCAMRAYTGPGLSGLTLLVPGGGDEYSVRRVEAARASLERLARDYLGVEPEFRRVERGPGLSPAFHAARRALIEALSSGRPVVVCLSAGMRAMLLALLLAAFSIPRNYPALDESRVEVDLESGEGYVSLPLKPILTIASLPENELRVLNALWDSRGAASLDEVAEATGLRRSTAHRALSRLVKMGLAVKRGARGGYEASFP
jgi:CRISPR locus-related DNA-binding protein